jgi:hypothetical protein
LEGLEFHSPEMIDAMQQYFDLLWRDPRAIRLRTSAAGTLESAVSRVEAELRAFGKYQQHRRDRGLASGDPGAIETYLSAERRFEGEKELRNAIRSLHGSILWYEAHHSINSLDVLHDAVDKYNVRAIRIMSGDQNLQGNPKRTEDRFEKFAEEMAAIAEIGCEWRILKAEQKSCTRLQPSLSAHIGPTSPEAVAASQTIESDEDGCLLTQGCVTHEPA